jgi:hypothetical protein
MENQTLEIAWKKQFIPGIIEMAISNMPLPSLNHGVQLHLTGDHPKPKMVWSQMIDEAALFYHSKFPQMVTFLFSCGNLWYSYYEYSVTIFRCIYISLPL